MTLLNIIIFIGFLFFVILGILEVCSFFWLTKNTTSVDYTEKTFSNGGDSTCCNNC